MPELLCTVLSPKWATESPALIVIIDPAPAVEMALVAYT